MSLKVNHFLDISSEQQMNKKAKTTAAETIILVPVGANSYDDNNIFPFPVDLMYPALRSILGLNNNPWSEEDTHTEKPIDPNNNLRIMQVEARACAAYVRFCRTGNWALRTLRECAGEYDEITLETKTINDLEFFLTRCAAPEELWQRYQNSCNAKEIAEKYVEFAKASFLSNTFDSITDTMRYFERWLCSNPTDVPNCIRINEIPGVSTYRFVLPHQTKSEIDALRGRIRVQFLALFDANPTTHDQVRAFMRTKFLPFYSVKLLADDE